MSLRAPGDASARFGPVVFLDPRSGAVLSRVDRTTRRRGDAFLAWQRVLHEGETFGLVGRIVLCIAGALPTLLVITGAMIWVRQRRKPRPDEVGAAAAAGSDA